MKIPESYSLDENYVKTVRLIAIEEDRSRSNIVNRAIAEYIMNHGFDYILDSVREKNA